MVSEPHSFVLNMDISIFGLGYVGCVGIGCLAQRGHRLVGVDPHPAKVQFINEGKPTIIEQDIDALIAEQFAAGRISATHDAAEAVEKTQVSFICVGTPPTATGHLDLAAIKTVAAQIGQGLRRKNTRHVIALRSTVLPGTAELVSGIIAENSGKTDGVDFAVAANPEFLREGTSILDFNHPPFTLVGSSVPWAIEVMREVYAGLDAPFIAAELRVAELMKYVCNSFHALKITFANEVGNICKKLEIDSHALMEIFCRDTKLNISKAYLKPGFAYGGSCLPKDLRALRTIAHDHYLPTPVLDNIERSNDLQKDLVCKRILDFGLEKVGFIGLAFKPGTDDLRESPIVDVIERLLGKGVAVSIFDPHVHVSQLTGANRDYILRKIPFIGKFITDDFEKVTGQSELIVVVNTDDATGAKLARLPEGKKIFELSRVRELKAPEQRARSTGIAW